MMFRWRALPWLNRTAGAVGSVLAAIGRRASALPAACVAMALTGAMVLAAVPAGLAAAAAPAYVSAALSKVADGTGHGTSNQTFVNAANGFEVGDNAPDDGVVSSGDLVLYRLDLGFTAASARSVRVWLRGSRRDCGWSAFPGRVTAVGWRTGRSRCAPRIRLQWCRRRRAAAPQIDRGVPARRGRVRGDPHDASRRAVPACGSGNRRVTPRSYSWGHANIHT